MIPASAVKSDMLARLIQGSARFTEHFYLPDALENCNALRCTISEMFSCFDQSDPPLLRVYTEGGQRFGLVERFFVSKRTFDLPLEDYIADAVGASAFCITLNGLTRWNDDFAALMNRELIGPIVGELGALVSGCDFYSFIGNYGWTPFGVHDDDDHSLLMHLGPGAKTVYVWPRQKYIELTGGSETTVSFDDLLPQGSRFELHAGDMLFIPKGDFHVLNTPDFSIMLGFTIFPENLRDDAGQALPFFFRQSTEDRFFGRDVRPFEESLAEIKVGDVLAARQCALRSNGFITTTPRKRFVGRPSNSLYVRSEHPIEVIETSQGMKVFVRGRVIAMPLMAEVHTALHLVNQAQPFTVDQFVEAIGPSWELSAAVALLDLMWYSKGIEADRL